jgi:hypothetical protein
MPGGSQHARIPHAAHRRAGGFNSTQAFLLAATRDGGDHVETDEVRRLLDMGCSHETAVRILL